MTVVHSDLRLNGEAAGKIRIWSFVVLSYETSDSA